jgi:hypothetical protein
MKRLLEIILYRTEERGRSCLPVRQREKKAMAFLEYGVSLHVPMIYTARM